jgi:excinuclease UvrABC ATPase subunit
VKRAKESVLKRWKFDTKERKSISDVLNMTVDEAVPF